MIEEFVLRKSDAIIRLKNVGHAVSELSLSKWLPYIIATSAFCLVELAILLFFPAYRTWAWFCFYVVISNFCLSIFPHEPVILLYGGLFNPLFVAILATLVTCLVEFFNYRFLVFIAGTKQAKSFTSNSAYQKVEGWFSKAPFLSLLFSSIASIPVSPFRFFAANSGYSLFKFLISVFVGRLPRYYLLALTGAVIKFPSWIYAIFFLLLLGFAVYRKIQSKIKLHEERG
ncbi:MAG: VTT domain-containing protein [Candidatus Poribacteria bacterium]